MNNAWSQARIKIHRLVLVMLIIGNDVNVFREDQDSHVGHVLQLCRDADVKCALDSDSVFRQCRAIVTAVSEGDEALI